MRILFLDDELYRHQDFQQNAIGATVDRAWSAEEAIKLLQTNKYDIVFLDHDLSPEQYSESRPDDKNGQWVCREMVRLNLSVSVPWVFIHSLNPSGSAEMLKILGNPFRSRALYIPMAWKYIEITSDGWKFNFKN